MSLFCPTAMHSYAGSCASSSICFHEMVHRSKFALGLLDFWLLFIIFLPDGATAQGGPWPPLQYAFKPLDSLLCLSICLHPSFSCPWTHHPAILFLVFLFVLLHTAFHTSILGLRCLAVFLYYQAIVFFGI